MNPDRLFDSLRTQVMGLVPSTMDIAKIEFEASLVVIYVKNYDEFSSEVSLPRTLAQTLRRRVDIRPDPSMLEDTDSVEKKIRSQIPESAGMTDINFDANTGEAIVEAINPNEVVGNEGSLLAALKKESGWNVKVIRSPPIPSKTISDVRGYLRHEADDRSKMLKEVARNLVRPIVEGEQWIRVTTMGGFRQVGRSASLLTTRNSRILIDCGLDPGSEATPYFAIPEVQPLDSIDAVVITHAHLDHCGTLPALFKYGYKGPVYCTAPTRDLMALLQLDNIKLAFGEGISSPSTTRDISWGLPSPTSTSATDSTTSPSPEIPSSRRPGSSTPRSTSSPGARPSSSSPPTEATTTCSPPGRTPPSSSEI